VAADAELAARLAARRTQDRFRSGLFDNGEAVDAVTAELGPLADLAPEGGA
jgi:hypothetical protein